MFKLIDLANLFCISKRTMERRIKTILPILRKFNPNSHKHFYNIEDAKNVIKHVGIPPENEYTRQIRAKFPELFD
jgi:hypothetical protein